MRNFEEQVIDWVNEEADTDDLAMGEVTEIVDRPPRRESQALVPVYEGQPAEGLRRLLKDLRGEANRIPNHPAVSSDFMIGYRRALEVCCEKLEDCLRVFELIDLSEDLPMARPCDVQLEDTLTPGRTFSTDIPPVPTARRRNRSRTVS